MLRTTGKPSLLELGHLANLQDLRSQLTNRLAMLLIVASGLAMWQGLPQGFFSITAFVLFSVLLGLGLGVQALISHHPTLARYLLVWGLNAGLIVAIGFFTASYLPFLGLLLIFLSALLISGSELATAAIILAEAAWLTYGGRRDYPLFDLAAVLTLGIAVAWLAVNTLYTTLQWTQNMQQRAERLLDEVRNQRAELSRVLKSTEITNSLLRRTQRELIIARKQAEEARRLKEQFAANISHELRTPLNLILGFSEIMSLSPEVYGDVNWSPTLRRDVYQIYRSSRHLVDMIDDILDLSRFEMVGFTLSKESTPLEPLLRNTASIAADLFRGHPVRLEVDIPSDLPTLELDRTRIRQVLLNLLNNAQRFTPEGTVQLTAKKADNEVIISVSDTGAGIPAEKLPHIFDEFFQVDFSLRRSHQGAGLGLAISKRFVQLHGGSIWAKSQEGVGSTFSFSLPTKSTYFPPTLATDGDGQPEPSWIDKPAPTIVVVDPDPSIATLMRRNFNGYEVVQLTDSTKIKETVMLHHPRAVVINAPPIQPKDDHQDVGNLPVPGIECSL
ncbi:MAG: HAMP domain-containing sensor histidine kinase, partial [Chloroflexota bacterium]